MARFNGMSGSVVWAAGYDTNVKQFTVTDEIDLGKALDWDSSDNYEEVLSDGPQRWSGSITVNMDDSESAPTTGSSGAATLTCTAGRTWTGTIVLQSITNTVQMTEAPVEMTFAFLGSGTCTRS